MRGLRTCGITNSRGTCLVDAECSERTAGQTRAATDSPHPVQFQTPRVEKTEVKTGRGVGRGALSTNGTIQKGLCMVFLEMERAVLRWKVEAQRREKTD